MEESRKNVDKANEIFTELIDKLPTPISFIHYIRFARRAQGQKEAREVFVKIIKVHMWRRVMM